MAASPIYQRAKLVQFGFTNSHPDFTKGGDHMWSNSTNQAEEQPHLAEFASKLGFKRPAVLHLNTDWGRTAKDAFLKAAPWLGHGGHHGGGLSLGRAGFPPNPGPRAGQQAGWAGAVIVLCRWRADQPAGAGQRAHCCRSWRARQTTRRSSSNWAAAGVEGDYVMSTFFPGDPRPEVQAFVKALQGEIRRRSRIVSAPARMIR